MLGHNAGHDDREVVDAVVALSQLDIGTGLAKSEGDVAIRARAGAGDAAIGHGNLGLEERMQGPRSIAASSRLGWAGG